MRTARSAGRRSLNYIVSDLIGVSTRQNLHMQVSLYQLGILALALIGACRQPEARAAMDAADVNRRCLLPDPSASREAHAVCCAEWFLAWQGYTLAAPIGDTAVVVP